MKKLLFVAALGVAGMVSAKGFSKELAGSKANLKDDQKTERKFLLPAACSNWVTVHTDCGSSFYLCSDRYEDTEQMVEAAEEIADIKCGN